MNDSRSTEQTNDGSGGPRSPNAVPNRRIRRTHSSVVIKLFLLVSLVVIINDAIHWVGSDFILVIAGLYILIGLAWVVFTTNLRVIMVGITATCICFSIMSSHWPLKIRFYWSRSSFEQLEKEFSAGESIELPRIVGLFKVHKITRRADDDSAVCFSVVGKEVGDFNGIVYDENQADGFNIWSHVRLDGSWCFVIED